MLILNMFLNLWKKFKERLEENKVSDPTDIYLA